MSFLRRLAGLCLALVFGLTASLAEAQTPLISGATFDPAVHGHWSRQVGDQPLVTLFVRG